MKTCRETAELLTDYIEGSLPAEQASMLKAHLSDCPPCEAFLKSFKMAGDATRVLLMKQIPGDFQSRLKTYLKARCSKH